MENAIVAGIVAVVVGLAEVIKALVNALIKKKEVTFHQKDRDILKKLMEMHDQKDQDGIPLWYVPRSQIEIQATMVQQQQQIANSLVKLTENIDRLEKGIEKLRDDHEH